MTSAIVQMNGISKSFGSHQVLQGLDWQIEAGSVIGLLGRNGAGKSTLLESMLGLRETNSGSVQLFGTPLQNLSDVERAKIGYVPQNSDLFGWLTPLQMLEYFKAMYPHCNQKKVDDLLLRWGFYPQLVNKPIKDLSAGEQQRLSIIRALAHQPELLILDEPVASLDPVGRREFLRELVDDVLERGTTVIFSTHILTDLERVAMDVAFLKDGKMRLQAPLDNLLENAHRIVGPQELINSLPLQTQIAQHRINSTEVSALLQLDATQVQVLRAQHPALRIDSLSLEDIFIEVTK